MFIMSSTSVSDYENSQSRVIGAKARLMTTSIKIPKSSMGLEWKSLDRLGELVNDYLMAYSWKKSVMTKQSTTVASMLEEGEDYGHFEGMPHETLATLIKEGYANPGEYQNSSPSIGVFEEFMKANNEVTAHGYIILPPRDDYRVSLEGVEGQNVDQAAMQEVIDCFGNADEFNTNLKTGNFYAWWD